MTHDDEYVATVQKAFAHQFHKELRVTRRGIEGTDFERTDQLPLTKKHVLFLDGLTIGFWTRNKPGVFDSLAANNLRQRCASVCYTMADKAKSVGIRRALERAGAAVARVS